MALEMRGERSKAVRAVRNKYDVKDDEDSEISYSVAYQKIEDDPSEVSAIIPYQMPEDDSENNLNKTMKEGNRVKKGRPYKVCGGKTKDGKGIVAMSFKELVEKGKILFYQISYQSLI
jgi:hypothetical protein